MSNFKVSNIKIRLITDYIQYFLSKYKNIFKKYIIQRIINLTHKHAREGQTNPDENYKFTKAQFH